MPFIIDILVIVVIVVFAAKGYRAGLFQEALTFVGVFIALVITAAVFRPLGELVHRVIGFNPYGSAIVCGILIFILIMYLFALGAHSLTRMANKIKADSANHLGGLAFGVFKGAFISGVICLLLCGNREVNILGSLAGHIDNSHIAPLLMRFANGFLGLFGLGI